MTSKAFELAQLSFGDSVKAAFGASDDLQIYHDGSNSYVDDTGTGALILRGNSNVTIGKYTGETMGYFEADGSAYLYHNNVIKFQTTSVGIGADQLFGISDSDTGIALGANGANIMQFYTGNSERMKLDSSGNIFMGSFNSSGGSAGVKFDIGGGTSETEIQTSVNGTATRVHYAFRNDNGEVGKITTNGSATTYATSSDYRLKENVTDVTDGITRIKQLSPKRFNFIADANKTVDGFIAHEVSSVVPEAIAGEKDEVRVWVEGEELPEGVSVGDNKLDSNDKTIPKYQGIDQSKLVPLLTAALQEAITEIETLKTKVAALEAG